MSISQVIDALRSSYMKGEPLTTNQERELFRQLHTLYNRNSSHGRKASFSYKGMTVTVRRFENLNDADDRLPWIEYKRGEPLTTNQERELFRQLHTLYNRNSSHGRKASFSYKGMTVTVRRFENLNDADDRLPWIEYKRVSTVYSRKMYNKFFVPIWGSVTDKSHSVGYIVFPQLTPLKEVLKDFRDAKLPNNIYLRELKKILRLCFAPVALALDALHTPQPSKRVMYYHRDVCLGNIYMRTRGTYGGDQRSKDYEDARIMLTKLTRGSHKEFIAAHHSLKELQEYHHRQAFQTSREYHRRHDWNSFGVYILEVLNLLWPKTTDFKDIKDYTNFASELKDFLMASEGEAHCLSGLVDIKSDVKKYIEIAEHCLILDSTQPRIYHLNDRKFEYKLSLQTAQLLNIYKSTATPDGYEAYNHPLEGEQVADCQSCLLCPQEMETKVHNEMRCTEICKLYCFQCYINGERLFCPKCDETASASLGHHSSYAVLFYGEHFNSDEKDAFKKSTELVERTLRHKLICGIRKEKIFCKPLFGVERDRKSDSKFDTDEAEKRKEKECLTPREALDQHCRAIQKHIHSDENPTCSTSSNYTIFIHYCGHGTDENHKIVEAGSWYPTEGGHISKDYVDECLQLIYHCPKPEANQPGCEAKCVFTAYIAEHCYPADTPQAVRDPKFSETYAAAATLYKKPVEKLPSSKPDISCWLELFLRSLFSKFCSDGKSECGVKQGNTDVCKQIRNHVHDFWSGKYLDVQCLALHAKHTPSNSPHQFGTKIVVELRELHTVLAYYHPEGVYLKVFPYIEGEQTLMLDFDSHMTYEKLKSEIKTNLGKRSLCVCLLTNRSDDECDHEYSKYNLLPHDADKINDIVESQVLFYHVVKHRVKVTLKAKLRNYSSSKSVNIRLPLETTDLQDLVDECSSQRSGSGDAGNRRKKSQLPNLLVHIVDYWRHEKEAGTEASRQPLKKHSQDSSNSPTNLKSLATPAEDSGAVEASKESDEELIQKSFVELLMGNQMPKTEELTWKDVENRAKGYLAEHERPFAVSRHNNRAIVEWADIVLEPSLQANQNLQKTDATSIDSEAVVHPPSDGQESDGVAEFAEDYENVYETDVTTD
ncbi:uncharacterized protein [Watersipora subatra]|uniref:uncharacterized protein n=1 Tax=Watersipora subatra TaxID=2589382 RepID=UPI00355B2D77